MNVLVVGSGGREHALAWKIKQSPLVKKVYCAPGNGGIAEIAECVAIDADDISGLVDFAKAKKIDLTVVGPEIPLVMGIVDIFQRNKLKIFGPSKDAARLEGSKVFSKTVMAKYGIPTAPFKVFENSTEAKKYVMDIDPPVIIKADGLAAGKGVIIAKSTSEAIAAITDILDKRVFGDAGNSIIIEDFIDGQELSVLAFTDGKTIIPLASSQDHKRAYDNDEGPNTGGMGAYSPCPLVSHVDLKSIVDGAIRPLVEGLASEGIVYKGLLYAGIMISKNGPVVLEYNVRFGDPETQAVLPRLKEDIVVLFDEVARGELTDRDLKWDHRACITVVVASGGYPGKYEKQIPIEGLDSVPASDDTVIFHAGTVRDESGVLKTSGGRILSVSALGATLQEARASAYDALSKLTISDSFYRSDIGSKALHKVSK
jgi:phosphoribosylamine---glycine ligase